MKTVTVTPTAALAEGRHALAALIAGAVGIGFAPIFVRLSELGPSATAFHRLALALPAMLLWLGLERCHGPVALPTRADSLRLIGAGLFFAADLAVWHWSIRFTSVANATLLANFAPLYVTGIAWAMFGQRPTARFVMALGLGLGGAVALMGESLSLATVHLWGDGLALVCAGLYAGYLMMVAHLRSRYSTATIMAWSGAASAVVLLPVALLSGEGLVPTTPDAWGVLLGLALLSHVGGQGLIAAGLAHLPPAFGSMVLLVQPAVAALLAWAWLGEALSWGQAAGAVAIIAGIRLARSGP